MAVTRQQVLAHLAGYPRNLTWASFSHVAQSPSPPYEAQTSSRYSWGYRNIQLVHGVYKLTGVHVRVVLQNHGSWVVSGWLQNASVQDKQDLLRHEQGHFDITGLVARDLCYNLLSLEISDEIVRILRDVGNTAHARLAYARHELAADAQQAADDAGALHRRVENTIVNGVPREGLYERETNHSHDPRAQQRWNEMFQFSRTRDTSLWMTLTLHGYNLPVH